MQGWLFFSAALQTASTQRSVDWSYSVQRGRKVLIVTSTNQGEHLTVKWFAWPCTLWPDDCSLNVPLAITPPQAFCVHSVAETEHEPVRLD